MELIQKEFTYVSYKHKLVEKGVTNIEQEQYNINTEFTEQSVNSIEDELMRNDSSHSVILCPFNT